MIEVLTREFGGSVLTRCALAKAVPAEWYESVPRSAAGWKAAAERVSADFSGRDWFAALSPAFGVDDESTNPALERLRRVVAGNGVVVTTGQQPGLFGGPIYTWSKALTALALADQIEKQTGIPAAAVFWAATDDSDYVEASSTVVTHNSDVHTLQMPAAPSIASMSRTPLGDVEALLEVLEDACGSAIDVFPIQAVRASYAKDQTIGDAYVKLLRTLMEPLGISVLDAAHPAVRSAGDPLIRKALSGATDVRDALAERSSAIEQSGDYKVQVQPVPNLSLVFNSETGERKRVQVKDAVRVASTIAEEHLSPNVLLRPVMERQILPTVSYVAGPAEYAYFAQVTAIADSLEVARPRVISRWSGTIIEPHVREKLDELGVTVDDFQDPHAIEGRVAREEMPQGVRESITALRESVQTHSKVLLTEVDVISPLRKAVGSFEVQVEHRIARLERRYAAAVKRSGNARLHDVAVARSSLFPNGAPQERTLNIIPFFARYGAIVREEMLQAARRHVETFSVGD